MRRKRERGQGSVDGLVRESVADCQERGGIVGGGAGKGDMGGLVYVSVVVLSGVEAGKGDVGGRVYLSVELRAELCPAWILLRLVKALYSACQLEVLAVLLSDLMFGEEGALIEDSGKPDLALAVAHAAGQLVDSMGDNQVITKRTVCVLGGALGRG